MKASETTNRFETGFQQLKIGFPKNPVLTSLPLLVICLLGRFKCLTSRFLSLLSLFFQLPISFHHHPVQHPSLILLIHSFILETYIIIIITSTISNWRRNTAMPLQ